MQRFLLEKRGLSTVEKSYSGCEELVCSLISLELIVCYKN